MNKVLAVLLAAGLGAAVAGLLVAKKLTTRHSARLAEQQAAWQAEKAALEAALDEARSQVAVTLPTAQPRTAPAVPTIPARPSPAEIIARLRGLKNGPPGQIRAA